MGTLIDLTGQRFGRLVVVGREDNYVRVTLQPYGPPAKTQMARWRCRCDCGGETVVMGHNLRGGRTKSCGCYRRDRLRKGGCDL